MEIMQNFHLPTVIRVLLAVEGALLIIYGFMTGASFLSLVMGFLNHGSPLSRFEPIQNPGVAVLLRHMRQF